MPTTKPGCKLGPGRFLILSRVKHKHVTRNFWVLDATAWRRMFPPKVVARAVTASAITGLTALSGSRTARDGPELKR